MTEPKQPDSLTTNDLEESQDALRAAEENVTILEGIRDRMKLELQRLRERSSVEMAEAQVAYARLLRAHNELTTKTTRLEAECAQLRLSVQWHDDSRRELLQVIRRLVDTYETES